jgi:hypothetical protein
MIIISNNSKAFHYVISSNLVTFSAFISSILQISFFSQHIYSSLLIPVPCVTLSNFLAVLPSRVPISLIRPLGISVSFHKCQFARISNFTNINYETIQSRCLFRFNAFGCVWRKEFVHPWNKWSMIFAVNPACCRYWAFSQPLSVGQSLTMSTALHNLIFHRDVLQYVLRRVIDVWGQERDVSHRAVSSVRDLWHVVANMRKCVTQRFS